MTKNNFDLGTLASEIVEKADLKSESIADSEPYANLGLSILYRKSVSKSGSEEIFRITKHSEVDGHTNYQDFTITKHLYVEEELDTKGFTIKNTKEVLTLNYRYSHPKLLSDTFSGLDGTELDKISVNSNFLYKLRNLSLGGKEYVSQDFTSGGEFQLNFVDEKINLKDIARFFLEQFTRSPNWTQIIGHEMTHELSSANYVSVGKQQS